MPRHIFSPFVAGNSDSTGATGPWYGPVDNTAALTSIPQSQLISNEARVVGSTVYVWDPLATEGDYEPDSKLNKGVAPGYWVSQRSSPVQQILTGSGAPTGTPPEGALFYYNLDNRQRYRVTDINTWEIDDDLDVTFLAAIYVPDPTIDSAVISAARNQYDLKGDCVLGYVGTGTEENPNYIWHLDEEDTLVKVKTPTASSATGVTEITDDDLATPANPTHTDVVNFRAAGSILGPTFIYYIGTGTAQAPAFTWFVDSENTIIRVGYTNSNGADDFLGFFDPTSPGAVSDATGSLGEFYRIKRQMVETVLDLGSGDITFPAGVGGLLIHDGSIWHFEPSLEEQFDRRFKAKADGQTPEINDISYYPSGATPNLTAANAAMVSGDNYTIIQPNGSGAQIASTFYHNGTEVVLIDTPGATTGYAEVADAAARTSNTTELVLKQTDNGVRYIRLGSGWAILSHMTNLASNPPISVAVDQQINTRSDGTRWIANTSLGIWEEE